MSLDRIRTDVVGSLLRPQRWKEARLRFDTQVLKEQEFQEIELECVKTNLALQEAIGLDVVTDGEVGRLNFQDSFGLSVSGYAAARETVRTQERRAAGGAPLSRWEIPDLAAPGTPREVIARRQSAVAKIVREPEFAERMTALGMELMENGTDDYVRFVKEDLQRYAQAVKAAGVRQD